MTHGLTICVHLAAVLCSMLPNDNRSSLIAFRVESAALRVCLLCAA